MGAAAMMSDMVSSDGTETSCLDSNLDSDWRMCEVGVPFCNAAGCLSLLKERGIKMACDFTPDHWNHRTLYDSNCTDRSRRLMKRDQQKWALVADITHDLGTIIPWIDTMKVFHALPKLHFFQPTNYFCRMPCQ